MSKKKMTSPKSVARMGRITGLAGIMALSLILSSCSEMGRKPKEGGEEMPEIVDKSYNVKTEISRRQALSSSIKLAGDVEAARTIDVYPDAAGKVVALPVDLGDYVTKGTVLLQIDPSMPGLNYAVNPVKAPINGTITAINVDMGQTVSQQVPVVQIGQLDELQIVTQVPERFIYQIRKGLSGEITSTATHDLAFDATVTELSPVVNQSSRTMEVILTMDNPDSPIKAGMFVSINLITSTTANALSVPENSLVYRSDEAFIYVVKGDRVVKTPVVVGRISSGLAEILSGIEEGDEVVTEGKSLLSDDSKVKIVNSVSFKKETTEENNS